MAAEVWSVTGFRELGKDGIAGDRKRLIHPDRPPPVPYLTRQLAAHKGPVIAASGWIRALPDHIRNGLPRRYTAPGTDGCGRSDTRPALRVSKEVSPRIARRSAELSISALAAATFSP